MTLVPPGRAPTVILADDEPLCAAGLGALLGSHGFVVAATVTSAHGLDDAVAAHQPKLVVVDPAMGDPSATLAAIASLVDHHRTPVLALTRDVSLAALHGALENGCLGVVPKTASMAEVLRAVQAVATGEQHVHQKALTVLVHGLHASASAAVAESASLSPREMDVLSLIAEGMTNAAIADRLSIAPATVKTHVENLLHKLDASDRAHAVSTAMRRQMLR